MEVDPTIVEIRRNLALTNEIMSQLTSVQVHQASQLVSHEKLLKIQEQRIEEEERWRVQHEQRLREAERYTALHERRMAEMEESMAKSRVLLAQLEVRMAEIGDKLDGLIGFMEGYFRKE